MGGGTIGVELAAEEEEGEGGSLVAGDGGTGICEV